MRIEREFHKYHFDDNTDTGYLYHSGSLTAPDSTWFEKDPLDLPVAGYDTIYQDVFIDRLNVSESTDQQLIDNIYMAMELDRVDRLNEYNWNLFFDKPELLKHKSLKGHSSLDATMKLKIEIENIDPIIKFDSTQDIRHGFVHTVGTRYFQKDSVVLTVVLSEARDRNSTVLPGYIRDFY